MSNGYQKSNGCGADKEGGNFLKLFSTQMLNRSTSARLPITPVYSAFQCAIHTVSVGILIINHKNKQNERQNI
jgi:hypothetical protein